MRVDLSIPHGATLGRYELLAPIGTGGMATVILARQRGPRGFEKAVVLKVVHPHLAHDQAAIDMLLDEARVAAQISHHNVVQTYELGEAGGTYFIAMEYLAGESLSHVLKAATTGAPAPSPVLGARIVADVAEGLHAAHELRGFDGAPLGVIHRDVSPSNVVVLYNGGVKVVDFGIAKAHGRVTSTQNGRVKGKYGYMSPEQIHDDGVDRRADVFSLGVVLWETLALRRLFREDNIVATLHQIMTAKRVPPSHYRPEVPSALDAVALRALEIDPARRYASAAEMKAAIDDAIWQARCGAADIQAYMTALFADRIAERQQILARVAHAAPRLTRREIEVIGAAFDDTSSLQMAKAPPRELTRATAGLGPVRVPILAPVAGGSGFAVAVAGADTFYIPATRVSRRPSVLSWRAKVVGVLGASLGLAIAAAVGARGRLPAAPPADLAVAALERPTVAGGPGGPSAGRERLAQSPDTTDRPEPTTTAQRTPPSLDVAHTGTSASKDPLPGTEAYAGVVRGPRVTTKKPSGVAPGPSADQLTALGTQHFLAGDLRAAEHDFRAALAADRRNAAAHRGLGLIYQRTGRDGEAVAHFRRYLELAPKAHDAAAIRTRIEALEAAS